MIHLLKKTIIFTSLIIIISILFLVNHSDVYAEYEPLNGTIYVDKQPIKTKYVLKNGHLYVPALFFKETGAYIDWNTTYKSAVFRLDEKMFALPVDKEYYDEFIRGTNTWKRHPLESAPFSIGGKPFVPLVTVSEKLGMGVTYDHYLKKTFITTNHSVPANQISNGGSAHKLVALTFDDGPDEYYTSKILDVLKEKNVHATFFMMGKNVKRYPRQVRRIVAEGHGIGNHTYNHPDLRNQWTERVTQEIESTQHEIAKIVGRKSDLLRPPYGATTKADISKFNELGLRNILWSVDTLDWKGTSSKKILETVHEQIYPGGIILQHNFESTVGALDGTVEALPKIIDELRAEGYTFVTVQTLLDLQKQ